MASNGSSVLKMPEIKFTKLFINGAFIDSISGKKFETRDPRTGDVITEVAEGDKEDVDLAVKAAREAFDHGSWPRMSGFAGIPDGVINVITGYGPTAGAAITSHMDVDAVSFTGSTEVGKLVMGAAAASNLKTVSLELGGKCPLIVFNDADINMSVQIAWQGGFFNKGEMCVAGSRVYVQEGIYDEFLKKLIENVKDWVIGDPFDPQVHQGPQVDKEQFEKVLRYIEAGKREGATLLTGGKAVGEKGYYIEPTIFTDVKEDLSIAKDEIFGPVICVMKFKTIEEAIEKANNTRYGLAAGILTNDLNVANRVSRSVRAGIIWVNCFFITDLNVPCGGHKMSGFGKDSGLQAMEKYLNVKSVFTPIYNSPWL
ncbi:aldehyde dehydrogenase family 2 member C4-like isoform X3 [Phalaenopsis equestris]|uniref:aldehyde dehydrogenase family 2 member C4-like isoform X3 n=1 Tax=Phalaenopsis equestris TaxID=78828 RepID=UPI0009E40B3D|nr:aldehyde dehydrogenase family 2 member C4-like isoform X3 [Phalaenopsis equestris]